MPWHEGKFLGEACTFTCRKDTAVTRTIVYPATTGIVAGANP